MKNVVIVVLAVLFAGSLAGNYLEYRRYSSLRPIMEMGDEVVTRKDYQDRLDYKYGKSVLNKLAFEKLVSGAATKAHVMPLAKDVDDRINQIERRTPSALSAVKNDPAKMAEFRDDIKMNIAFENLRIKDIKVSDAEVTDFYNKNRAALALPAQVKTSIVAAGNAVDASTASELLKQDMSLDLIARQPRLRVVGIGGFALPNTLPPEVSATLNQTVYRLKQGDIATVPFGHAFLVLRVNQRSQAEVPPLASIRPTVERMAKLAKADPSGIAFARLYHDANVTFEVDKYAAYFSEILDAANQFDTKTPKKAEAH